VLVTHEAGLYWLGATLSSLFFCREPWDEQDIADLELNLLCGVGGHDHFGANEATIFKVSKEPRIKRIARIRLRHEDQACRVRQLLAGAIRVSIPMILPLNPS
jgi:hypothetical protein